MSKEQVDLMTKRSIIPVRVVELMVDSKEVMSRAWKDRYSPDRYVYVNYYKGLSMPSAT